MIERDRLSRTAQRFGADNGSGMPESVRQIFDPFYTTKAVGKGTGLGLSISYQIVTEKRGGSLEYFSNEVEGTQFVIQLPIQIRQSAGAHRAASPSEFARQARANSFSKDPC